MNELSSRLHKVLENPTVNTVRPMSKTFHPSSASIKVNNEVIGSCLRQQYYRITIPQITNKGQTDHKFSAMVGDQLHRFVVDLIKVNGYAMGLQFIAEEDSFYDTEHNIGGRSDIIVWDTKNNELIGIDTKTVGEYKAGVCALGPAPEHVLQCMLYLYIYNKQIPQGMPKINKWYIWYISRTENYAIKAKKHSSPLAMAWDSYITLEPHDGSVTVHTAQGSSNWKDYTVDKILARYEELSDCLAMGAVPSRDYDLAYSEDKILGLYKLNKLTRKVDIEKIEKWINKGAPAGKLNIDMGDGECGFCAYKDLCWNINPTPVQIDRFNLPRQKTMQVSSKIISSQNTISDL